MDDVLTGASFGFFLSFMIGPVFFILIETSITKGFRAALSFDIGVVLADICFIAIAYFSSFGLIEKIKDDPALYIFGGGIMAAYGLVSFVRLKKLKRTEVHVESDAYKRNYFSLATKGFLLNFINIGVLGFWLAMIITIGPQLQMNHSRLLIFFGSVLAAYMLTDIIKILLAKQLRQKLTPKNILRVKKVSSVILIVFGLVIMSKSLFKEEPEFIKDNLNFPTHSNKIDETSE